MMKKLMLFSVIFFGFWGCCTDVKDRWNIDSYTVVASNENGDVISNNTITGNTLQLNVQLATSFVSEEGFHFENPLITSVYALSCEDDGHLGLEDAITQIVVVSSQDFGSVAAGSSLNEFITIDDTGISKSVEQWATDAGTTSPFFGGIPVFVISGNPDNVETRTFSVIMSFESGKVLSGETVSFVWE